MQYVAVKFKGSERKYTYENASQNLIEVGEDVIVEAREVIVHVAEIITDKPNFACKPVLGKFLRLKE